MLSYGFLYSLCLARSHSVRWYLSHTHHHHHHHRVAVGPVSLVGGTAAIYTSLLQHPGSSLTQLSFVFMMLLAVQYALQPRLSKKYISPKIDKQSVAMVEEVVKTGMAAAIFFSKPAADVHNALKGEWRGVGCCCYCVYWMASSVIFVPTIYIVHRLVAVLLPGGGGASGYVVRIAGSSSIHFLSTPRLCYLQWIDTDQDTQRCILLLVDHG